MILELRNHENFCKNAHNLIYYQSKETEYDSDRLKTQQKNYNK